MGRNEVPIQAKAELKNDNFDLFLDLCNLPRRQVYQFRMYLSIDSQVNIQLKELVIATDMPPCELCGIEFPVRTLL